MADPGPRDLSPSVPKSRAAPVRERFRTRGFIADFGLGRICAAPGCETALSRYNDGRLCWVHDNHGRSSENTKNS